ncbi:MAG: hypothetical protein ACR2NA_07400 [Solirubrobacterales bacterium]
MGFFLFTFVGIGLLVAVLLLIARLYPGSGADVIDWKLTRSMETEAILEVDDIDQMLEAQNERRRRSGRKELSMDDVHHRVREDERVRERARPAQERLGRDTVEAEEFIEGELAAERARTRAPKRGRRPARPDAPPDEGGADGRS